MAVILPTFNGNSPISVDLMYKFYDNKAITPQIRAALEKRDAEEAAKDTEDDKAASKPSSESKFGPAAKLSITDQIIRMNIENNSTKIGNKEKPAETSDNKRPARYDALTEIRKRLAAEEATAKEAKDAKLKEISDKVKETEKPQEETGAETKI